MTASEYKKWLAEKDSIENQFGGFTSYNLKKLGNKFIMVEPENGNKASPAIFFERIKKNALDFLKIPLSKATVLDLACLEGESSFVFAAAGAKKVIGIEGREENIVKAEFARKTFAFTNLKFEQKDVRNLNYKSDSFDVVLALGIAYHLDTPSCFNFFENLYKWGKGVTIIDTHISFLPKIITKYKGYEYSGIFFDEAAYGETYESSIGNAKSFWFTKYSLFSFLQRVGYTGIYECKFPNAGNYRNLDDRVTLICTKEKLDVSSVFLAKDLKQPDGFPERDPRIAHLVDIDEALE